MTELYHYGIKGQKWGVRRYQNEDGSYTAEGRKRYEIGEGGKMSSEGKRVYRADKKIDRVASKAKKNYDKSMEIVKTRSDAKTKWGKNKLGNYATDMHWKAEKQNAKANRLSQKYSEKFGYKKENKMMNDLSKTASESNKNFRPTTDSEKAALWAISGAVTAGSVVTSMALGIPFVLISYPKQSTYEYRIKDEDKKVKVKDLG